MKQEKLEIDIGSGAGKLSGVLSTPDDESFFDVRHTLVVMMHDIPYSHARDHDDLFGFLRDLFDDHGYSTCVFDFESCGDSDGREEAFSLDHARENLKSVISWAQNHRFNRFIFVACGAASALCLDAAEPQSTKAVFLFWPVIDLAAHARRIFYEGDQTYAKGRKIGQDLIRQMQAFDPRSVLKKLWVPVLIQYGASDDTDTEQIKTGLAALRIDVTSYADGGPGLTDPRHRSMIAHHVSAFLKKYA